jgi:hypothetical protein
MLSFSHLCPLSDSTYCLLVTCASCLTRRVTSQSPVPLFRFDVLSFSHLCLLSDSMCCLSVTSASCLSRRVVSHLRVPLVRFDVLSFTCVCRLSDSTCCLSVTCASCLTRRVVCQSPMYTQLNLKSERNASTTSLAELRYVVSCS